MLNRSDEKARAGVFGAIAGTAAMGFGLIAVATSRRSLAHVDRAVERWVHVSQRSPAGRVAKAMAPAMKNYTVIPLAIAVGTYVMARQRDDGRRARRSGRLGACAIVASSVLASLAEPLFDQLLPQPPVPKGRAKRRPVFPSGHTFKPVALALTSAHVLSREGLASPRVAYAVAAVLPVASGGAKLVTAKHWLSDVVGGALAGVVIGSVCCAGYELERSEGEKIEW